MRAFLRKILQIRDTPEAQARGMAVGFFFGVTPLFGLQILLAVAAAHLLRGNRVLAGAMTAVSNPLTSVPLYGACWLLGKTIVGGAEEAPDLAALTTVSDVLALGPGILVELLVGTTVVGALGGVALYLLSGQLLRLARNLGATKGAPEADLV